MNHRGHLTSDLENKRVAPAPSLACCNRIVASILAGEHVCAGYAKYTLPRVTLAGFSRSGKELEE